MILFKLRVQRIISKLIEENQSRYDKIILRNSSEQVGNKISRTNAIEARDIRWREKKSLRCPK